MKVLFLCKSFPSSFNEPIVSGEVKNAFYLALAMARKGVDVTVWAAGSENKKFAIGSVEVRLSRILIGKGVFKSIFENLSDALAYQMLPTPEKDFDFIINHRLTAPLLLPMLARRRYGVIFINTAHGTNWPEINANRYNNLRGWLTYANGLMQRILDRASYRSSDKVVSVSSFQVNELERVYGVPAKHIVTIRNGVDLSRYCSTELSSSTGNDPIKTVLYVGRMVKKKGLDLLLRAAMVIRNNQPGVKFCFVVGTAEYAKITKQFYAQLELAGLNDICQVLWDVPEETLPGIYRSASVLVAPSEGYESLPTVILEALASGIPVVTTKAWGATEVLKDDFMLLNTRTIKELVDKIEYWLEGPVDAACVRSLVDCFDWSYKADEYLAVMSSCKREC